MASIDLFSRRLTLGSLMSLITLGNLTPLYASESMPSWENLLEEYTSGVERDFLKRQYNAFKNHTSPKVADPIIRQIPIEEGGEEVVNLKILGFNRLQMLPDAPNPGVFQGPEFNAGTPRASWVRQSLFYKLKEWLEELDRRAPSFGYKQGKLCLKVFEGIRDIKFQERLFETQVAKTLGKNPTYNREEAEQEASKWVSPVKNNVPVHSTGAAVDVRLWDLEKNDFIDMGHFGVIWGSPETAPLFCETTSPLQKKNRLFLVVTALKVGLINYAYEWWHFSWRDRYALFWQEQDPEKRKSAYGAVQAFPNQN